MELADVVNEAEVENNHVIRELTKSTEVRQTSLPPPFPIHLRSDPNKLNFTTHPPRQQQTDDVAKHLVVSCWLLGAYHSNHLFIATSSMAPGCWCQFVPRWYPVLV